MAFKDEEIEEIRNALMPAITTMVNGAAATQKKLLEERAKKDQEAFAKMLDEKLSTFKPKDPEPEPDKDGKNGKNRRSPETDAELQQMRKSQEELRQSLEAEKARAQRELARNVANAERTMVYEVLAAHGVDAVHAKAAYAMFKLEQRLESTVDEEADRIVVSFREDDGMQSPLPEGVKRWAKTDAAKIYLPVAGAKGSGSRPTRSPARGPNGEQLTDEQKQEFARGNLGRALAEALD